MSSAPTSVTASTTPEITSPKTMEAAGVGSTAASKSSKHDYKGFVAGVFSGIAKLSGVYLPFLLSVDSHR